MILLSTGHILEFEIGQIVYLKHCSNQYQYMVTGIYLRPNKNVPYELSIGTSSSNHYPIEISLEKDIIKSTTN